VVEVSIKMHGDYFISNLVFNFIIVYKYFLEATVHGCIFTHFLLRSWSCPLSSHDASFSMSPESLHSEALHLVDLPPNLGMNWYILKVKVQCLIKITYDAQTILKSPIEQKVKLPAH